MWVSPLLTQKCHNEAYLFTRVYESTRLLRIIKAKEIGLELRCFSNDFLSVRVISLLK